MKNQPLKPSLAVYLPACCLVVFVMSYLAARDPNSANLRGKNFAILCGIGFVSYLAVWIVWRIKDFGFNLKNYALLVAAGSAVRIILVMAFAGLFQGDLYSGSKIGLWILLLLGAFIQIIVYTALILPIAYALQSFVFDFARKDRR
jgi:hypothetical protein